MLLQVSGSVCKADKYFYPPVDKCETDSDNIDYTQINPGYRVLINGTGLNDFAEHDNEIATYIGNYRWTFTKPNPDALVVSKEDESIYIYDADTKTWKVISSTSSSVTYYTPDGRIKINENDPSLDYIANKLDSNFFVIDTNSWQIQINEDILHSYTFDSQYFTVDSNGNISLAVDFVGKVKLDSNDTLDYLGNKLNTTIFTYQDSKISLNPHVIDSNYLAYNIDAVNLHFNADKVDYCDVNDSLITDRNLWTARQILIYILLLN